MGWQVHYCSSPGESKWSPTYDCFLPPTGPIYLTTPGHKTTIPSFLDKHKNNHKFHNDREFNSNENGPKGHKSVKKENKQ